MFENVAAFARSDDGRVLRWLVDTLLHSGSYVVSHRVICTSDHGLPQTRRRWFLVAIRADCAVCDFAWPDAIDMLPLALILGPRAEGDCATRRPGAAGSLASRNVDRAVEWLAANGVDTGSSDIIIDCNASEGWCGKPTARCPCLTRSRPQGLWNVSRGCRISAAATMRLQGVLTSKLVLPISDGATRHLAGNAMSLCVVERLLRAALVAIGVHGHALTDRWGPGSAQADLVREAWGTMPPTGIVALMPDFVVRYFQQDGHLDS